MCLHAMLHKYTSNAKPTYIVLSSKLGTVKDMCFLAAVGVITPETPFMACRGVGYKSDFMTYCTNKLYGVMFARELATRLKVFT